MILDTIVEIMAGKGIGNHQQSEGTHQERVRETVCAHVWATEYSRVPHWALYYPPTIAFVRRYKQFYSFSLTTPPPNPTFSNGGKDDCTGDRTGTHMG
jgi:hypothetical protein